MDPWTLFTSVLLLHVHSPLKWKSKWPFFWWPGVAWGRPSRLYSSLDFSPGCRPQGRRFSKLLQQAVNFLRFFWRRLLFLSVPQFGNYETILLSPIGQVCKEGKQWACTRVSMCPAWATNHLSDVSTTLPWSLCDLTVEPVEHLSNGKSSQGAFISIYTKTTSKNNRSLTQNVLQVRQLNEQQAWIKWMSQDLKKNTEEEEWPLNEWKAKW